MTLCKSLTSSVNHLPLSKMVIIPRVIHGVMDISNKRIQGECFFVPRTEYVLINDNEEGSHFLCPILLGTEEAKQAFSCLG